MLGIAQGAAVAAAQDFPPACQASAHQAGSLLDADKIFGVGQKPVKHGTGFRKFSVDEGSKHGK
ncbi:hypothetical protein GCM10027346_39990 [Hymenobacter seoulensis]